MRVVLRVTFIVNVGAVESLKTQLPVLIFWQLFEVSQSCTVMLLMLPSGKEPTTCEQLSSSVAAVQFASDPLNHIVEFVFIALFAVIFTLKVPEFLVVFHSPRDESAISGGVISEVSKPPRSAPSSNPSYL